MYTIYRKNHNTLYYYIQRNCEKFRMLLDIFPRFYVIIHIILYDLIYHRKYNQIQKVILYIFYFILFYKIIILIIYYVISLIYFEKENRRQKINNYFNISRKYKNKHIRGLKKRMKTIVI